MAAQKALEKKFVVIRAGDSEVGHEDYFCSEYTARGEAERRARLGTQSYVAQVLSVVMPAATVVEVA